MEFLLACSISFALHEQRPYRCYECWMDIENAFASYSVIRIEHHKMIGLGGASR